MPVTTKVLTVREARKIMGSNFFGPREIEKHFPAHLAKKFRGSKIPFNREKLEACRDGHVLVAVPQIAILEIFRLFQDAFFLGQGHWNWQEEKFITEKEEAGWYLIRKDIYPGSSYKSWFEQAFLLNKTGEKVLSARVMIFFIVAYQLSTGEKLFEDVSFRTTSLSKEERHVSLGNTENGIHFYNWWDGGHYDGHGVCVGWLPKK